MDTKHYERLLALVMEKLEQTELEKTWLKHENAQLKDQIDKLKHKESVKEVLGELKNKMEKK